MKHTAGRWLALLLSWTLLLGLSPTALAAGTEEEGPALTGVMLNHYTLSMAVGQSDTLSATLQMSDGSTLETLPSGYTAVWTVANDRGDEVRVTAEGKTTSPPRWKPWRWPTPTSRSRPCRSQLP